MPATNFVNLDVLETKRPYDPLLFVNRDHELKTIAHNVRQLQMGSSVTEPIVNFWGGRGIGKTWILYHLLNLYRFSEERAGGMERAPFTLLYEFSERSESGVLPNIVRQLGAKLPDQLPSLLDAEDRELLDKAKSSADLEAFVRAMAAISRRFVPLILLDNADKVSSENWENLERQLIEPLVSTNRVLIVVAGRRQVPRWHRFEVRRRVMETQESRVHPFDKSGVARQLAEYKYSLPVDLVFPYTGGNPHLVYAIAENMRTWTSETKEAKLNQMWLNRHDKQLLEILQSAESHFLESASEELRLVLNQVSPLRFYRIEALRFMQEKAGRGAERPDGYYLSVLRTLEQQTELVWWDRERRAYMTSEAVRRVINRKQLLADREQFDSHQQQALTMYWEWVNDFPQASEDFIVEIWFHLINLHSPKMRSAALHREIWKTFTFARQNLSADRFMILQKQLDERDGDREILDLLPEDLRKQWYEELGQLLRKKAK